MVDETGNVDIRTLLLDSLLGIPFAIDWDTGQFIHVGPQITDMLGYNTTDWVKVSDWGSCIHPDDSQWAMGYCVEKCEEGSNHEFEYRMIKKNGDTIWVRDIVNVVHDREGQLKYIFGFIIDITNNKVIENQIISDKNEYQKLSLLDDLTKLYNRRKFDSYFIEQWNTAGDHRQSVSLIIVDIDFFKNFNDFYGHLKGDEALVRVAEVLRLTFKRQQDIVCRIGGEEFAIILPDTNIATANDLSHKLRSHLEDAQIPHEKSSISPFLTVSIGVGAALPSSTITSQQFHANVDELLYAAKNNGRNCIETGSFT